MGGKWHTNRTRRGVTDVFGKKITFFVFPEGKDSIKRYSIPRWLPWIMCLLVIAAIASLSTFSYITYQKLQASQCNQANAKALRQKSVKQNLQIHAFADKIQILEKEMARLRQFDQKLRAMTGKTPLLKDGDLPGVGGSDREAEAPQTTIKTSTQDMVRQMHRDLDRLLAEASIQEQCQHEMCKVLEDTKSIMASTPDGWPLKGPITSYFGYRSSPFGGRSSEFHRGLDISAPNGTPILAPADGIVVEVDWNSGYGQILVVNHGYGVVSRYAHISQSYVQGGQRVKRGEKICAVGATGRVTGPHLHYEVIVNGIPVNPMRFLEAKN
jgi:murein DD-endopeptidase MepM/ murein hydrolase activator NlpD